MVSVSAKLALVQKRGGSISAVPVLRAVALPAAWLALLVLLSVAQVDAATRDATRARETELQQVRARIESVR
jgi:hypothetical protein